MITDWKQAWLAKMSVCGLQEEGLGKGGACYYYPSTKVHPKMLLKVSVGIKEW